MQRDDMVKTSVYVTLTVHHSGHIVDNKELVVTCGYSIDGRYGYFICLEDKILDAAANATMYKYTDQRAFFPKKDESSFAQALQYLKSTIDQ